MLRRHRLLLLLLLLALLNVERAQSQEQPIPEAATASPQETQDEAVQVAERTPADTLAAIQKIKQQATESEQLAPEVKTEIIDLCDKAIAKLTEAENHAATTAKLQQELDKAAASLEALQNGTTAKESPTLPDARISAEEMRSQLLAADQQVSAAREKLQKNVAEIQRRAERRKALPELLANCREQLAAIQETLKQSVAEPQSPLDEARKLYQLARREFRTQELQLLEQENRTYEATSRLWLARRDQAEKKLQAAVEYHKAILALAEESQRREAEKQAQEARRSAINAHSAIKEAAAINAELAERNQSLVSRIQEVQKHLAEVTELEEEMQKRLEAVTKKADAAIHSPAIGVMLRGQQTQLPDLATYRQRMQSRPAEISQLELALFDWDSQRSEVLQVDKAVEATRKDLEASGEDALDGAVAEELRRVIEARAGILAELYSNADSCVTRLVELDTAETKLIATTQKLTSFIAEHVLWVRSDPSLSINLVKHASSSWLGWEETLKQLQTVPQTLVSDLRSHPVAWFFAALLAAALLLGRNHFRSELKTNGATAEKPTATLFRPTLDAALATVMMAAPAPVVLGFVGYRLYLASSDFVYATGWAILMFAAVYAMLDLVRHASRASGLGISHFGWDSKGLSAIRHAARSLQLLALPLLALAGGIEVAQGENLLNVVGRLALIVALLVIGVVSYRLFRATGPLANSFTSNAKYWLNARFAIKLLVPLSIISVTGLILASAAGYHYTAIQLTRRVFISCVFVFACLALRSLLMRWLLVAYRRVAMQQAREKRQALIDAQSSNPTAEIPRVEVQPQLNLSNINQQARKLVGVGAALAFVASMWFVWCDVLPALGIFSRVELWPSGLVSSDPDAPTTFITLADVIISIGIFAFTWFASSNLPGLLEIVVFQKLPLDAGARYAASSVTRYLIVVLGTALFMRQLGVGWQSVQWLVAAMTVGLGFGLQEIFANFVSGIILLFERPARVGDTVTIGAVTGTVTKIQIRATTILDWDSKELIVPNKEFVTGNLVNWTLTNANLRLVVKVGVAYGSDTRLATELLYRVAAENPDVLSDPEPAVVFNEFGDSSLNFELRLFVSDLNLFRRLRHEIHLAIDDLFRQHNIEIAFPQCDLHIRSMPSAVQISNESSNIAEAPTPNNAAA